MLRFRKPEIIPLLFTLCTVGLMFGLCIWQVQRLEWKNALLADIDAAQRQAPRNLLSYSQDELPNSEWHNVIVTGRFLNAKELYATPRYLNDQMGYAILTPLEITTPTGKEYVMINRGWVPPADKDPKTRADGNPTGLMRVEGVVRGHFKQPMFRPDNSPDKNLWFWYDIPAMAAATKLRLLPVMIDATAVKTMDGAILKTGPTPFPLEVSIRNDHLGYAITWFLIGFAGIVMFGIYHYEPKKNVT